MNKFREQMLARQRAESMDEYQDQVERLRKKYDRLEEEADRLRDQKLGREFYSD